MENESFFFIYCMLVISVLNRRILGQASSHFLNLDALRSP